MSEPGYDHLVSALVATGTERPNAERLARKKLGIIPVGDLCGMPPLPFRLATHAEEDRRYSAMCEHDHQVALFVWRDENLHRWPELRLLIGIPNFHGRLGRLTAKQGAILKAEGRRRGVSDTFLPVARGGFHGLWTELKRIGGKPTDEQLQWRAEMRAQGYRAEIVEGWHAARDLIIRYLDS
jgi:hypothetical protein